jgi:hypothetical protein
LIHYDTVIEYIDGIFMGYSWDYTKSYRLMEYELSMNMGEHHSVSSNPAGKSPSHRSIIFPTKLHVVWGFSSHV